IERDPFHQPRAPIAAATAKAQGTASAGVTSGTTVNWKRSKLFHVTGLEPKPGLPVKPGAGTPSSELKPVSETKAAKKFTWVPGGSPRAAGELDVAGPPAAPLPPLVGAMKLSEPDCSSTQKTSMCERHRLSRVLSQCHRIDEIHRQRGLGFRNVLSQLP